MRFQGLAPGIITILIWGVTFVNTKVLLDDFSSFESLFLRFAVAYVALWAIKPRRFSVGGWKQTLHFAAMGLSGVAAYQFLENCAIGCTNASNVSILVSVCPMGTAILSALVLKEKSLTRRFFFGFVLSMSGVMLVCLGGIKEFHFSPFGDCLALLAMFCWCVYSVLITKANVKGYGPILAKTCALLGTLRATCCIYFIPVVTAVVAYFVLGESLTAMTGLGAILTILGVVICG